MFRFRRACHVTWRLQCIDTVLRPIKQLALLCLILRQNSTPLCSMVMCIVYSVDGLGETCTWQMSIYIARCRETVTRLMPSNWVSCDCLEQWQNCTFFTANVPTISPFQKSCHNSSGSDVWLRDFVAVLSHAGHDDGLCHSIRITSNAALEIMQFSAALSYMVCQAVDFQHYLTDLGMKKEWQLNE